MRMYKILALAACSTFISQMLSAQCCGQGNWNQSGYGNGWQSGYSRPYGYQNSYSNYQGYAAPQYSGSNYQGSYAAPQYSGSSYQGSYSPQGYNYNQSSAYSQDWNRSNPSRSQSYSTEYRADTAPTNQGMRMGSTQDTSAQGYTQGTSNQSMSNQGMSNQGMSSQNPSTGNYNQSYNQNPSSQGYNYNQSYNQGMNNQGMRSNSGYYNQNSAGMAGQTTDDDSEGYSNSQYNR